LEGVEGYIAEKERKGKKKEYLNKKLQEILCTQKNVNTSGLLRAGLIK